MSAAVLGSTTTPSKLNTTHSHRSFGFAAIKILRLVDTRPEIIRLSRVIGRLDGCAEHVLAHTGQNRDARLSGILFEELGVRAPDVFLGVGSAGQIGQILESSYEMFLARRPDRLLVFGGYQQRAGGAAAGDPGVPHGGGQPVLRRPRPGG